MRQTTTHLLMIRPVAFNFNPETAVNNAFQQNESDMHAQMKAASEFDGFVDKLRKADIDVTVIEDTPTPYTPDSIFPNNWISFHEDGTIILYPMFALNRRAERKPHVIEEIKKKFEIKKTIDLTQYEGKNLFLEGTGSMVLDRTNKIAYACISHRTDLNVLEDWCTQTQFRPCAFTAQDHQGGAIYHTNVMMCVADQYVVVCLDSVRDTEEKNRLIQQIADTGKEIITITLEQMNHFAGNMLQVQNGQGKPFLVMSSQAYHSLTAQQISIISNYNEIIHSDLTTIETNGGGSARCMMAEVFLSTKQ
ncbi:MAG: citrulline utilization hydrolase CtlX [Bacteroidota bacterium]|jgi:hypothetical protein